MKRSMLIFLMKSLPLVATLFLLGCPLFRPGCQMTVQEPGIYVVTFLDQGGNQASTTVTVDVGSNGGVLFIGFCSKFISIELILPPPPPNLPPVCSQARPSLETLANDPMNFVGVDILGVTDPEGDPISIEIDSIFQDEPTGGLFVGDLTPDAGFPAGATSRLRAERDPAGNGRVYTINFTATSRGLSPFPPQTCTGTVKVGVPVVPGGVFVDEGPLFDSTRGPAIDVLAVMSDSPDPVNVGSNLTYAVTATNPSSLIAEQVQVLWVLSNSVDLVSAPPICGQLSGAHTLPCVIQTVAPGSSATVTIVVRPTAAGTITSHAEVRPLPSNPVYHDPNPGNSTPEATTTVVSSSGADLAVTKTDSPDPVTIPNQLNYTIVVTNNGPLAASGVVLTDLLPAVEVSQTTTTQGNCVLSNRPRTLTCNLGGLASGASATITVETFPFATGTITNTATVTANESDPNTSNNTATQSTTVNP